MNDPLSATSNHGSDVTSDLLLPSTQGGESAEEVGLLQASIQHQTDSSVLEQSFQETDTSILQQSLSSPNDSSILQTSMSNPTSGSMLEQSMSEQADAVFEQSLSEHSESSILHQSYSQESEPTMLQSSLSQDEDRNLLQNEDLRLITADCSSILQCDLSTPQSLSVDSLDHSQLRYNNSPTTNTISSLPHNVELSLQGSFSANLSQTASQLAQSVQPTYTTTNIPIASLGQFPFTISGNENLQEASTSVDAGSSPLVQCQTAGVRPALTINNVLQQAIALNYPPHILAALANLPFLQQGQTQTSGPGTTLPQDVNPVSTSSSPQTSSVLSPLPTTHSPKQKKSSDNRIARKKSSTLQKILPNTLKVTGIGVVSSDHGNKNVVNVINIGQTGSGGCIEGRSMLPAVLCATGTQNIPEIESLLPQVVSSVGQASTSAVSSLAMVQSALTSTLDSSGQTQQPTVTSGIAQHMPFYPVTTDHGDQTHSAPAQTQFSMPLPVMSTHESSSLSQGDSQSLTACLTPTLLQSLSNQSGGSQIVFNSTPRAQGTTSPAFPQLSHLDLQQMAQLGLLRQSTFNLQDSADNSGLPSMTTTSEAAGDVHSSQEHDAGDSYAASANGISPSLRISSRVQTSGVLSNIALSLSDNMTAPLYLTSPMSVVPVGHDQDHIQDKGDNQEVGMDPTGPSLALANMTVIDMLLKHSNDVTDVDQTVTAPTDSAVLPVPDKTPKLTGLYCVECKNSYKDGCKYHNTQYMHIPDRPVLPRSKLTVPACCNLQMTTVKMTVEEVNQLGVFSVARIPPKTEFGPLIGKVVTENAYTYVNSFTWKVFYTDHHSIIDTSNEDECNWLIYLKPAPTVGDQNVVVYQRGDQLYFVTCTDVKPGVELRFWFAKDYAKLMGLPTKPTRLWPSNCPFCHICQKLYSDWKALNKHMKSDHPNAQSRRWSCEMCSRRFSSSTKLKTHVVALHMRLKPFDCQYCAKKFSDQSNLRQHQKTHTGERKHSCSICSKTFRQKAHLKSHMIIHTGTEGFQCRFCVTKLARQSDLKSHELKHTKEKVYPCALCTKLFYKLANYKRHMLVHSKDRKFQCPDCQKSFYTKYHLTRHMSRCKVARLRLQDLGNGDTLYSTLEQDAQMELGLVDTDAS